MNRSMTSALACAATTWAALGSAPAVRANTVATPSTACVPSARAETPGTEKLEWNDRHVSNAHHTKGRSVICPVVRQSDGANEGVKVYVDGYAVRGASVQCMLFSYDWRGRTLGYHWATGTTDPFEIVFKLSGDQAPRYSYQNVTCHLPPLQNGGIIGILTID